MLCMPPPILNCNLQHFTHRCWSLCYWMITVIKTHDNESRGQEETAIIRETKNTRPLSE